MENKKKPYLRKRRPQSMRSALFEISKKILPTIAGQTVRKAVTPHHLQKVETPPHTEELQRLYNQNKNQRCLILGTAPSLREMDLRNISIDYTFLLNRSYLYTKRPEKAIESAIIANPHAFAEYGREAFRPSCDKFFLSSAIPLSREESQKIDAIFFTQWEKPRIYDGFFQTDLADPLYHGTSVAFTAIQLAYFMGFSEIVLAGIEFDFKAADPHMYTSSDAEIRRAQRTSIKNSSKMVASLEYCAHFLKAAGGVRIRSLSPNQNLGFIEYCNTEDLSEH